MKGELNMTCYRSGSCGPYEMLSCNECPASKEDYMYKKIRKNIEETWPNWKIEAANDYTESVHGQKLRIGMQNETSIKERAIESALSRLKRAKYYLSVSKGNEETIEKKKRTVEVAAYILRAVESYEE